MPRPRKQNKLPTTTIVITVEFIEVLASMKKRGETYDELLRRIVRERNDYKDHLDFAETAYKQTSDKNGEYYRKINELETDLSQFSYYLPLSGSFNIYLY